LVAFLMFNCCGVARMHFEFDPLLKSTVGKLVSHSY